MKLINIFIYTGLCMTIYSCSPKQIENHTSEHLKIYPLTANTYIHESYLQTQDFGNVACNGLIYMDENEAIIFDTPTTDSATIELLHWITVQNNRAVEAVIVSHFHSDCLGGLDIVHAANIPSYANQHTITFAKESNKTLPQNGFENRLTTTVGDVEIQSEFFGEGHTADNIVSTIVSESVLFGGCLIKETGATEGYVGDGNVQTWSGTVREVRQKYGNIQHVVPGHGQAGNAQLLDYTIELFSSYEQTDSL